MPRIEKFKNKNNNFIETGSFFGDGIDLALQSGFKKIISFEIDFNLYTHCVNRLKDNPEVELILGDSAFELKKFLDKNRETSFTYWLDGHYSSGITGCGIKEFPIMEELIAILDRDVYNEVIYIDDMRIISELSSDINLEEIKKLIYLYKPKCKISFESSDMDPEDILVIEY
jgi:hypothetical protein